MTKTAKIGLVCVQLYKTVTLRRKEASNSGITKKNANMFFSGKKNAQRAENEEINGKVENWQEIEKYGPTLHFKRIIML